MRFGVLGPLAVWADGGELVPVPEPKVRTLLAALLEGALAEPGRPVPAGRLAEALWGDRPPRNLAGTLQARVSQLRRVLDDAEPGARALVALRPAGNAAGHASGYVLDVPPDALDAGRFAALVARAGAASDARARAHLLADALTLWRGPAFDGFAAAGFAGTAAAGLEERRLVALEEQAEARLELGEHATLAAELAASVARHPLRERLRAAHLRALYLAGRRGEALAGYHELRTRLADELGVDPGPELAALHQAMLTEDPALEARTPPAAAPARVPAGPPAPLGELIGREDAVRETRALLASDRLVTLTGSGGVGKTRLALETAARSAADHPDGVWVVELASGRPGTAAEVAELAAHALGLRDGEGPGGPVERLARAVSTCRALLVLDNCEHVIEPVAELAERLLAAAPGLRILATAQEPLGLAGERLRVVPPLDPPGPDLTLAALARSSAVELFVARAAAAAPGFALDAASAPWVAAICRRLDGVPLALELAATRVRALGVRELAARLDDRFGVLAGGRRGGPARQRTLRAMIDWSWGLLTAPERVALRRLAVHAGGCTLEAAEAVGGAGVEVLARLVDRSLVVRTGDRYRLLESVAAYSLERLRENGEEDEVRRRHVQYYTELAERAAAELRGPGQCRWLDRLDQETANLRAALEHASGDAALRLVNAQGWYWYLRGRFGEARRALGAALAGRDTGPAADPAALAEARTWLTGMTMASGEGVDSEALRRTALKAYAALTSSADPDPARAEPADSQAPPAERMHAGPAPAEPADAGPAPADSAGARTTPAKRMHAGSAPAEPERADAGLADAGPAPADSAGARTTPAKRMHAGSAPAEPERADAGLADAGPAPADSAGARTTPAERMRAGSAPVEPASGGTVRGEFARAKAEWFLSHVHWPYGDLKANEERTGRALAVFRAHGDRWYTAAALATRAKMLMARGDLTGMRRDGAESLELFTALGDHWGGLEAGDVLSRYAEITGDHAEAGRLRRAELRLAEELRMWPDVAYRLACLGRIALLTGDLDEARALHERALALAGRQAARSAAEFAEIGLGLVARRRGDLAAARAHLRGPLAWLRGIGGTPGIAFVLAQLGYVAEERGDAGAARALHAEGLAAARATGDPRAVALALEGLAGARSLAGEHAPAARLLGAAAALRASAGAPLPAAERGDVDRAAGRIEAALGVATFTAEFRRGRTNPEETP